MAIKATQGDAHIVDAARAAALAAHAAAGLAAAAKHTCAARLLRSAEAVSRAAVAVLLGAGSHQQCPSSAGAAPPALEAARPSLSHPQAKRKRRKAKDKVHGGEGPLAAPPGQDPPVAQPAGAATPHAGDVDAYIEGSEHNELMMAVHQRAPESGAIGPAVSAGGAASSASDLAPLEQACKDKGPEAVQLLQNILTLSHGHGVAAIKEALSQGQGTGAASKGRSGNKAKEKDKGRQKSGT